MPVIVVGRKGNAGSVQLFMDPIWPTDTTYFLEVPEGLDPRFLAHQLTHLQLGGMDRSTAIPSLQRGDLKETEIVLPPLSEQETLVAAIEEEFSRIEAAAALVTHAEMKITRWKAAYLGCALRADQDGWTTAELGQLISNARYGTSARSVRSDEGIPVLRIPNIQRGRVDFSDLKVIAEPSVNLKSAWASPGDVLTVRSNGSRSLIGRAAAVPQLDRRVAFASYLIALTPLPGALLPEFLALALEGPDCRAQLETMAASTAGQYNLSAAKLRRVRLSLPPLAEQHAIVAQLRDAAVSTDAVTRAISRTLGRAGSLRHAILEQAFSGVWADAA